MQVYKSTFPSMLPFPLDAATKKSHVSINSCRRQDRTVPPITANSITLSAQSPFFCPPMFSLHAQTCPHFHPLPWHHPFTCVYKFGTRGVGEWWREEGRKQSKEQKLYIITKKMKYRQLSDNTCSRPFSLTCKLYIQHGNGNTNTHLHTDRSTDRQRG